MKRGERHPVVQGLLSVAGCIVGSLTWLTVLGWPVVIGGAIHRHLPTWPTLIPWTAGVLSFALFFFSAEWIMHGMNALFLVRKWVLPWSQHQHDDKRDVCED